MMSFTLVIIMQYLVQFAIDGYNVCIYIYIYIYIYIGQNIKKHPKLPAVYNIAPQCLKNNKVALKTTKM
jgi:hypothetical protein